MTDKVSYSTSVKDKFGGFINDLPTLCYNTEFVKDVTFKDDNENNIVSIPVSMILDDEVRVSKFNFDLWPSTLEPAKSLYFSIDMDNLITEVNDQLNDIKESMKTIDK